MKKMTALILAAAVFLSGWTMKREPMSEIVPSAEAAKEDVVFQEVFTFTDHEGNVSEPQILCSWEYDDMGRVSREEDQTGKTYSPEGECYTHSFAGSPRPDPDPLNLGTERQYSYDAAGRLCMITYFKTEYGIEKVWQGVPVLDQDGKMLSQTITGEYGQYEIGYTYDERGNLTQILCYHGDSDGNHYTKYTYSYDEYGLLVLETGIQYGEYFYYYSPNIYDPYDYTNASWERTYTYDEMGHLISGTFTDYDWNADMMNYWIGYETTDRYSFRYEGGRLTQVEVQCGDKVLHRDGSLYKQAKYASYTVDIVYGDTHWNDGLKIYSDTGSLSVQKGGNITLGAAVQLNGKVTQDAPAIVFQVEDDSGLEAVRVHVEDNISYIRLHALREGISYVTVSDTRTGEFFRLPITVYAGTHQSYTLSSVPVEYIEKYPTNFYNVQGLYVDSYVYSVREDGWADVSFDVYNQNQAYGVVEVFDSAGTLVSGVLIDKMTNGITSLKEVVIDNTSCMLRDVFQGDLLSYRQETAGRKKTSVHVQIPPDGYLRICVDPETSVAVHMINFADVTISLAALAGDVDSFDSSKFCETLTKELVVDNLDGMFNDSISVASRFWNEAGRDRMFRDMTSVQDYLDNAAAAFSGTRVEKIIFNAVKNIGLDLGENILTALMGPAGVALNGIFFLGKSGAILNQLGDFSNASGSGAIYIQNQGGGFRSCQQIRVECEAGISEDTSLHVYQVTLDEDILDSVKKLNRKLYRALKEETTHTYNISLVQGWDEVQPQGPVTVYIPVPDGLEVLAIAGKLSIFRMEEDGSFTEMDIHVENGCFAFTTDHFSLYTIVEYEAETNGEPNENSGKWVLFVIAGICTGCAAAAGAVLLAVTKRKKNKSK